MNVKTTLTLETLSEALTVRAALQHYVDTHTARRLAAIDLRANADPGSREGRDVGREIDENTTRARRLLEML